MVLARMESRGWALLGVMLLASLVWLDWKVTLGVAVGGVLALCDFGLMRRVLAPAVKSGGGKWALFAIQAVKYLVMGSVLGTLFWFKIVNPLASVVGVSIMFLIPLLHLFDLKRELEEVA
jgi:hypothetical protein